MNIFDQFDNGKLFLVGKEEIDFASNDWLPHAKFEGVISKPLISGKDTDNVFSYQLVRIEPNMKIGLHAHDTQLETHEVVAGHGVCLFDGKEVEYVPGNIGVMPIGVEHEIIAGDEGLCILAKFIPAYR